MLDRAWSETSYSARIKLYQQIEKRVLQDSPIIPLYYEQARVLVQPDARGFFLSPLGLMYIKTSKIWLANQPHPKVRL
jgi:ABC-type transport system substrate-binding protein